MSDPFLSMQRQIQALQETLERLRKSDAMFYSTGTFTPAFLGTGTAGTFTYSTQSGRYTRLGNLCYIRIAVEVSAVSVPPTGNLRISGLPFTSAAVSQALAVGYINNFNLSLNCVQLTAFSQTSATTIALMEVFDNAGTSEFPAASFTTNGILIAGAYEVA